MGVFCVYLVDNAGWRDWWVFSLYILWIMQAGEIVGVFTVSFVDNAVRRDCGCFHCIFCG